MTYELKSKTVEAIQWTGNNLEEIMSFLGSEFSYQDNTTYLTAKFSYDPSLKRLFIFSLSNNQLEVSVNDYIVKNAFGEYYPCRRSIFENAYKRKETK